MSPFSDIMTHLKKTHNKTLLILIAYAWAVNSTRPPTVKRVHVPSSYNEEVLAAIQFNYDLLAKANIKNDPPLFTSESAIVLDHDRVIWTWDKIYGKLREICITSKKGNLLELDQKEGKNVCAFFPLLMCSATFFLVQNDIEESFVGDAASFLDDEMIFKISKKERVDIHKVWEKEGKSLNESSSKSEEDDERESSEESESE